jgi:hypothetical protein
MDEESHLFMYLALESDANHKSFTASWNDGELLAAIPCSVNDMGY